MHTCPAKGQFIEVCRGENGQYAWFIGEIISGLENGMHRVMWSGKRPALLKISPALLRVYADGKAHKLCNLGNLGETTSIERLLDDHTEATGECAKGRSARMHIARCKAFRSSHAQP